MMESEHNSGDIEDIIRLSYSMLEHAEAGEWEIVAEHEVMRRRLINAFFSARSGNSSNPNVGAEIQELIQVNEKLENLSTSARDEARSALDSLNTGRTAINAYLENAV